jgi:hypothetical protein
VSTVIVDNMKRLSVRYDELGEKLSSQEVLSNPSLFA